MKRLRAWRQRRFDDGLFLEATAEVFDLRRQVERLKTQMEKDRREFIEERRAWKAVEATYQDANESLMGQLTAAEGQLLAWGADR